MRQTWKFQVSSWIENSTSCELIAFSRIWILSRRPTTVSEPLPFLEPPNITFYIWPIVCSLSVRNVTAWVWGDNRLERTNANTTLTNSTAPTINSSVPLDPMVTSWSYIVDRMLQVQRAALGETWLELTLNKTWTLTSLEGQTSEFAAFYYSVLVEHWRSDALHGDPTGSQWWSEARGSVVARQPMLSAQLRLGVPPWVLGCVCSLALIAASAISMLGPRMHQEPMRDGSVMDMMSLLCGSSLPAIIAGDDDGDAGADGRRRRAERTIVM